MRAVLCLLDAPSSHPFRLLRGPPLTPLSPPHPTSSGSANPLGAISKESRQTASRHPCCRRRSGPPPSLGEAVRRAALPTSTSPLLRTSPLSGGVKATVLHHLDFPLTPAPPPPAPRRPHRPSHCRSRSRRDPRAVPSSHGNLLPADSHTAPLPPLFPDFTQVSPSRPSQPRLPCLDL